MRLDAYAAAAQPYLRAFARLPAGERRLPQAHRRVLELAEHHLPAHITLPENA